MDAHEHTDDLDYGKERDQIIDAINSLGIGIAIDPFTSPAEAHDQIPLLAGVLAATLDVKELAAIAPDESRKMHQWMTGYHYGVTGVRADTPEAAHFCLGAIASRLHLTWAVTELMGRHHSYGAVAAALIKTATIFAAAASEGLEDPDDGMFNAEPLRGYHQQARTAITAATAALDAAEAWLRSNDFDIDTRN